MRTFFDEMMRLGVEGMMISPGYSYEKAPDQDHFLARQQTADLFRSLLARPKRSWRLTRRPCSWNSCAAITSCNALPGAARRTASLAGSGPAICSVKGIAKHFAS